MWRMKNRFKSSFCKNSKNRKIRRKTKLFKGKSQHNLKTFIFPKSSAISMKESHHIFLTNKKLKSNYSPIGKILLKARTQKKFSPFHQIGIKNNLKSRCFLHKNVGGSSSESS